jgi:hypothetical protein
MDDWNEGPPHPKEMSKFQVAYPDYPGGEEAYWQDFKAAAKEWNRQHEFDDVENLDEWAEWQAYYSLRRRVQDACEHLADAARIDRRNLSHWLVKAKGFPWRDDCDFGELRRLLDFVQDPATVTEAQRAPEYPNMSSPERIRAAEEHWKRRGRSR